MKLEDLAQSIFDDFGSPSDLSIPLIIAWLRANLGKLNILIGTCYSVDCANQEVDPELGNSEAAVYKELYFIKYYDSLVTRALSSAGAAGSVLEVVEGNRRVRLTNRNEIAKTYLDLRKTAQTNLNKLIGQYRTNKSIPGQVCGDDVIPAWDFVPRPYYGYPGYDRGFGIFI